MTQRMTKETTMKASQVGVSDRTPGKHKALNKLLGKVAGTASTPGFRRTFGRRPFHIIDCTAGDGQASDFSEHTSPGIIDRHSKWMESNGMDVSVYLFERSKQNCALLKTKTSHPIYNMDAADMGKVWKDEDILFVVNDPNTVADWRMPEALKHATKLTTVFSTLGCNVGGLKRLPRSDRDVWFDQMEGQIKLLQHWHDAILVTLDRDSSQWAYLVNAPKEWRKDVTSMFESAFKGSKYPVKHAWLKDDPKGFAALRDYLFLTEKERNA